MKFKHLVRCSRCRLLRDRAKFIRKLKMISNSQVSPDTKQINSLFQQVSFFKRMSEEIFSIETSTQSDVSSKVKLKRNIRVLYLSMTKRMVAISQ
jgi:hypothetical protein